jgi:hypothetical protein
MACLLLVSLLGTSSAGAAGIGTEPVPDEQHVSFAVSESGILVRDDSAPEAEQVLAVLPLPAPLYDLLFLDNRLYVARGPAGITVIDVTDHLRPVALFSFGSGHVPIGLGRQGLALVATDAQGRKVAYDLSLRDTPRLLPPPQPPAPPGEHAALVRWGPIEPPADVGRRLTAAGSTLLASSLLSLAIGALLFAAGDQAVAQDRQHQQEREAACKKRGEPYCGLGFISFPGLVEYLAGYTAMSHAVLRAAVGLPLLAVGLHKLRRSLDIKPIVALSPGTSANPSGIVVGAGIGLRF